MKKVIEFKHPEIFVSNFTSSFWPEDNQHFSPGLVLCSTEVLLVKALLDSGRARSSKWSVLASLPSS